MNASRMVQCGAVALTLISVGLAVAAAPTNAPAPVAKERQVTLEKRANNGDYGNSAYSFRTASQDLAKHKNYVDVLLNGCGLIHINLYSSEKNRICDLGAIKLDATNAAPVNAVWLQESVTPVVGNVYLEEISDGNQTMTVAFRVDDVAANAVKLTWITIKPLQGKPLPANHGAAGTHGQCGEKGHPEK